MNIPKNSINAQNVSFTGHKRKLDKTGYELQQFYYLYDPEKYKCEVELFDVIRDDKGNMGIPDPSTPQFVLPMEGASASIDINECNEIDSKLGFAYRFKLTDINTNETSYAFDNGTVIGIFDKEKTNNKFNVVLSNRAIINKNGPMQLIMPDEYYPGIENVDGKATLNEGLRAKALTFVRTHANKLGGNFFGIIARLPQLKKEGVKRIVGTPYTKDTVSSHLYWTENAYQVAPNFGTEQDFKTLQVELFKNGMNWIADAALVNEGFGGIHMSELLRKGQDSFSKNMFRTEDRVALGILPDKNEYTRMKIINAPFVLDEAGVYTSKNQNYNPSRPTYIQFYDDRLASDDQKKSDSPDRMKTYDNKNTESIYDITKHDDAVYPFAIEVSPTQLRRNVERVVADHGSVDLSNMEIIKRIADFSTFSVTNKSAAAGLEVWDGNVDIAKLNFYRCDNDDARFSKLPADQRAKAIENFNRGALAVRDYAISSGKYWTKLTSDTLLEYVSKELGGKYDTAEEYMSAIKKLEKEGKLPESVLENVDLEVIQNVLDDNYNLRRLYEADMRASINYKEGVGNSYKLSDYILRQSMDCPLETIPYATNLLGILTSPYIAKRASTDDLLGVSRYDISKSGNEKHVPEEYLKVYEQAENLYHNQIVPTINSLIGGINGISDNGMITDYGKYVVSEITPDVTKYLFVKALDPNADIRISDKGEFDFSNVDESELTMQAIGIPFDSLDLEAEAQILVNLLNKGMSQISSEQKDVLKTAIEKRFKSRSFNDFKIAEMIVDRTESGIGWRIDASKDVASIDSVRASVDSMTDAWNSVTDFWRRYNEAVLKENPHAYTTAEITDLYDLFKDEAKVMFDSDGDAERKFIETTGITAVANYNYFFSLLPELFTKNRFETGDSGWEAPQGINKELREKLDQGWDGNPGFLFQSPDDGVVNSYTFMGNHDKPRMLHCLGLDMGLFHSDFSKKEHREAAANCLNKNEKTMDFTRVNSMAVAMGSRLNSAFDSVLSDDATKDAIKKAVSQLASGEYMGTTFDATAFGTRPFEVAISSVLDQVEYNGGIVLNREAVEAKTLEKILLPAFDRFYSMYKTLMILPGSPTDFGGDKVAASGYETKAKNYHQQNRNVIRWEWLSDDSSNKYKFVKTFYDKMNAISALRSHPALTALNDGATVSLPIEASAPTINGNGGKDVHFNDKLQAMLRYNDKGSVVLSLHDLSGASSDFSSTMDRKETKTSTTEGSIYNRVVLSTENANAKQGLKHGLKVGTKFKNVRSDDKGIYKIAKMVKNGKEYYYLRKTDDQGKEIPITIKPEDFNSLVLYKVD